LTTSNAAFPLLLQSVELLAVLLSYKYSRKWFSLHFLQLLPASLRNKGQFRRKFYRTCWSRAVVSTFFVRVPPDIIFFQVRTPEVVGV
jgi:hypothetical protein